MADAVTKSMSLMPEYQEKYLKDLLANVYNVDEDTGAISGIASTNPLEGELVFDEAGNPVYEMNPDGSFALDYYDQKIQQVKGSVAPPDLVRFTGGQQEALRRLQGYTDPETGEQIYEGSAGSYQPFLDSGLSAYNQGVDLVSQSTAAYDPTGPNGVQAYYDPYVEDVIGGLRQDINKQSDMRQRQMDYDAVSLGAFSNQERRSQERAELAEASDRAFASASAPLRSEAFNQGLASSMGAFSDQAKRQQSAGTLFQNLGTGIGALGEATSALEAQDFNTQFNAGQLEQAQYQSEYDVQRAADLEDAYEPFARFSYMRDILQGMGGGGSTLAATGSPQASSLANIMKTAGVYQGSRGMGTGGLGAVQNTSGS